MTRVIKVGGNELAAVAAQMTATRPRARGQDGRENMGPSR